MLMPASHKKEYHNAFPGGYIEHVLRVIRCAIKQANLWEGEGCDMSTFTTEELVFAAINHDLGKIGTEEAEQYIPNDSEWHRKNLGKIYKYNPANDFMTVPDRSLFLLQGRGIKVSMNEYFGIKLHDGLYEDANKAYYISHTKESKMRTNLPIVLHHADHMASRIEYERWFTNQEEASPVIKAPRKSTPQIADANQSQELVDIFNNLFK